MRRLAPVAALALFFSCGGNAEKKSNDTLAGEKQPAVFRKEITFADHEFLHSDLVRCGEDFFIAGKSDEIRFDSRSQIERLAQMSTEVLTERASLLKVDVQGNVLWEKTFSSDSSASSFERVLPGPANTFYALKNSYVNIVVRKSFSVLHFDTAGKVLSEWKFHPGEHYEAEDFAQLPSGDFLIAGKHTGESVHDNKPEFRDVFSGETADAGTPSFTHGYLACVSADGKLKWEKEFKDFRLEKVAGGSNTMCYVIGEMQQSNDAFTGCIDLQSGKLCWKKKLPGMKNFIYWLEPLPGNKAAVFENVFDEKQYDNPLPEMIRFDSTGNETPVAFRTDDFLFLSSIQLVADGFIFSGYTDGSPRPLISYGKIGYDGAVAWKKSVDETGSGQGRTSNTGAWLCEDGRVLLIKQNYNPQKDANYQTLFFSNEKGDVPDSLWIGQER